MPLASGKQSECIKAQDLPLPKAPSDYTSIQADNYDERFETWWNENRGKCVEGTGELKDILENDILQGCTRASVNLENGRRINLKFNQIDRGTLLTFNKNQVVSFKGELAEHGFLWDYALTDSEMWYPKVDSPNLRNLLTFFALIAIFIFGVIAKKNRRVAPLPPTSQK